MIDHGPLEHVHGSRTRNRVVVVLATLGLFIPVLLYFLVSYVDRDPRAHSHLGHFLWSFAIPYLWPSAAVLLPASGGNVGDSIVFWTMSLVLNVGIYAAVGIGFWFLCKFVSTRRAKP